MFFRSLRAWLPASGSGSDVSSDPVGVEVEIERVSAAVAGEPAVLGWDAVAPHLSVTLSPRRPQNERQPPSGNRTFAGRGIGV